MISEPRPKSTRLGREGAIMVSAMLQFMLPSVRSVPAAQARLSFALQCVSDPSVDPWMRGRDPLELEEERTRLVNEATHFSRWKLAKHDIGTSSIHFLQICCPRTRTDVRAWIEKIIAIEQTQAGKHSSDADTECVLTQVPEKKRIFRSS